MARDSYFISNIITANMELILSPENPPVWFTVIFLKAQKIMRKLVSSISVKKS